MTKIIKFLFLIILIYLIQGCSNEYKKELLKTELKTEFNNLQKPLPKESAIRIIEVNAENFKITKNLVPDNEQIKHVKILGAPLNDVIALITEATDQDIIFQLQSNNTSYTTGTGTGIGTLGTRTTTIGTAGRAALGIGTARNNADSDIRYSNVYVTASNIGFGRLLKKTVGDKLSVRYDDGTYYLGSVKTVTLKIPSLTGLAAQMNKTLRTLGALNLVQDSVTSTVTFSAREKEYQDIMKYLTILRNNLYVIEYEIAIYDVYLNDKYSLGIDWSLVPSAESKGGLTTTTSSSFGSVAAGAITSNIGMLFDSPTMTGSMMVKALSKFGKVESIQKPKLLGIAGTDVTLIDGQTEQYISGLTTTAVGNTGIQTTTQNATAQSGLKITLNSNIMDGTVITNINLVVNDIVGYTDFSVGDTSYTQPKVRTKTITNNIRVQPGVPIIISGLFRHKRDKGYKGIPGLARTDARILGGSEYASISKSEMVIIVTPRVIKYVMK
ncbi:MAG: type II and III secretion system protein [Sulfurimonas sp.]|nr:type II and III secretion system protein [Sulfurimonas sp.]